MNECLAVVEECQTIRQSTIGCFDLIASQVSVQLKIPDLVTVQSILQNPSSSRFTWSTFNLNQHQWPSDRTLESLPLMCSQHDIQSLHQGGSCPAKETRLFQKKRHLNNATLSKKKYIYIYIYISEKGTMWLA